MIQVSMIGATMIRVMMIGVIEKSKYLISLILLLSFLTACAPQGASSIPTPLPTLTVAQKPTYKVKRGEVVKILELHGRVSAVEQEDLYFGTNGVVDEILVSRGDTVMAGQVLAYLSERVSFEVTLADARLEVIKAQKALDTLTDEAGLRSAEAMVAMLKAQSDLDEAQRKRAGLDKPRASAIMISEAEAQLALADKMLEDARIKWESVEDLPLTDPERGMALSNLLGAQQERYRAWSNLNWYVGHPTEDVILSSDAEVALADAKYQDAVRKYERIKDGPDPLDVDLAQATLDHAQLNLNKAQASLDGLTITAPFDGQVLSMSLTPGMQVTAYKPVMTVVDPAGLEITLQPSSSELAEISVGQEAIIQLPRLPGQELSGVVSNVPLSSSASSSQEGSDQFVRISFAGDEDLLTMGEVATVILSLESRENVLWISPAALRTFQSRNFVIIQDGEVQRRVDVRLGLQSVDRTEILEGLSEGQVVLGP